MRTLIASLFGLLFSICSAATGSWNGVAFTAWNGVAQTSWNGTAISCASGGSPALIANVSSAGGTNGGTTGAVDTTGANLLIIAVGYYPPGVGLSVSDSKSNTWTPLTAQEITSAGSRLYYSYGGTVGSGHTFTVSGTGVFACIQVAAFSNAASSPFDVQNGATATVWTTLSTGSVTPSQASSIVVAGVAFIPDAGTLTIDSSFTITNTNAYAGGNNIGGSLAYKILSSSSAQNPAWDGSLTPDDGAATIAVFKGL